VSLERAAVGDRLFRKVYPPITRAVIARYAAAAGDPNPIHLDAAAARAAGFPDVFAQGMLVMAYLGSAVTDAVPPKSLRSLTTRFVAITPVDATIVCEGTLEALLRDGDEPRARIALVACDLEGAVKLTGQAEVALDS
jgi:acyl dehydratase